MYTAHDLRRFLLRSHREIYITEFKDIEQPSKVTLVTAEPIPPIHLTCKLLGSEAGPFLKAKVKKLSTSWQAPGVIVQAGSIEYLLWRIMVDELLRMIEVARDGPAQSYMDESGKRLTSGSRLFGEKGLSTVETYAERAGKYMRDSGVSLLGWRAEASEYYEEDYPGRERYLRNSNQTDVYLAEMNQDAWSTRNSAQRGLLQIVVVLHDAKGTEVDLPRFVFEVAEICRVYRVRTSVRARGWHRGECPALSVTEWIRFDGETDEKIWDEEWA